MISRTEFTTKCMLSFVQNRKTVFLIYMHIRRLWETSTSTWEPGWL